MSNDRTLNNNRQDEYSWTGYDGDTIRDVDFSQCGACNYGVIGSAGEEVDPEDGFKPCGKLYENVYQNLGDPRSNPLEHFILEHCSGGGGLELFRYDHSGDGNIDAGAWVICNGGSNQQCGMDITIGCMDYSANNYNSLANVNCNTCCTYGPPTEEEEPPTEEEEPPTEEEEPPTEEDGNSKFKNILFINQFVSRHSDNGVFDALGDWVELYNSGECIYTDGTDGCNADGSINLLGFRFSDNNYPDEFCNSVDTIIPSGGFQVLVYDNKPCGTSNSELTNSININQKLGGGDIINIFDPDGNEIDVKSGLHLAADDIAYARCGNGGEWGQTIEYDNSYTPGSGISQECPTAGCMNPDACNYDESAVEDDGSCYMGIPCPNTYPTLNCIDNESQCPPLGTQEILINEITSMGTSDTSVEDDEENIFPRPWVELYNPNNYEVDLNGWTFADKDYPQEVDQRNILNEEFIIPPKGFAIVVVDDCDGQSDKWRIRYCYDHPGEQENATILPGQGVHVEYETNTAIDNPNTWDRIYTNYPEGTPGVIRLSFNLGGGDTFKIYNGDPENGGELVDQFMYQIAPAIYSQVDDDGIEEILDQSYARLWDGGPWGEVRCPTCENQVTYGTSNGDAPIDDEPPDDDITISEPLNLITIEGKYGINGLTDIDPSGHVMSIVYGGVSNQVTNSNIVDTDGKVKYSITFNGGNLSEFSVGFNLRTELNNEIVVLRSSTLVPVTNILGGQINYDFEFTEPDSYVLGCTDPTATNYTSAATLDNDACLYDITGCNDSDACTCDNESCLQYCEHCGTVDEYKCILERGFYNQNPNATGGTCQYPPTPTDISFYRPSLQVENFEWIAEYRPYGDSDEEFMYTYLTDDNFNNNIIINFSESGVQNYAFSVEGVDFRECRFTGNAISVCSINTNFDGNKTDVFVSCSEEQNNTTHDISCSVNDIIKLHSCIIDTNFDYGDYPCFDLNPNDALDERLIKLNRLNGKLYTQIADLHRGRNQFSPYVMSPFCCKTEWEEVEQVSEGSTPETCEGNFDFETDPIPPSCTGDITYSCGAPNSGDLNADGTLGVIDIVTMLRFLLNGPEILQNFNSIERVKIFRGYGTSDGVEPLCNFVNNSGGGGELPPDERDNTGIADLNADGIVDINDLNQLAIRVLQNPENLLLVQNNNLNCDSYYNNNNMVCVHGCDYSYGLPSETIDLSCSLIFRQGYLSYFLAGECPEEYCTYTPPSTSGTLVHPETGESVNHSSELLKCGDSYPQLGILNTDDFWDFDMNHLMERYQSGYYMETASECPGFVVPPSYMNWRYNDTVFRGDKTGPFRDLWYIFEYLGTEIGNQIYNPEGPEAQFESEHVYGGAVTFVGNVMSAADPLIDAHDTTTMNNQQLPSGGRFGYGSLDLNQEIHYGKSHAQFYICTRTYDYIFSEDINNAGAVTDDFCEDISNAVSESALNYEWLYNACCEGNVVKESFKVPFYGVMPFFNTNINDNDYYHKYSYFNTNASEYKTGFVPPCKEFLYDKMTTASSFDETLSDIVDELGFSYSIQIIEFETELISHVIITGETLPTIWLGTLTDLNIGEGYTITLNSSEEFGSYRYDYLHENGFQNGERSGRLKHLRLNMEYDNCGMCSKGSSFRNPNIDRDDLGICCLYPNKIIKYYEQDNEFETGVGKTYLRNISACDTNGDSFEAELEFINEGGQVDTELKLVIAEYNSDNCPGTLDCLGVCHEGLSLSEAQLLTTYAQIDQYGGCCLQGDIDLCGVCYGDSTAEGCDPSGFENIFGSATFNLSSVQDIPGSEYLNKGTLTIDVSSPTDISEIKFSVLGLNISSGNFLVGSEQPDFEIFTTPISGGTDVVIAPILSDTLFPTIPTGDFSFKLLFDNIYYTSTENLRAYIDYTTMEVYRFNQSIGATNLENLYTQTLTYYGCGDELAANADDDCVSLGDSCIQQDSDGNSFCIFTEMDCAGVPGGPNLVNTCGICTGPNTEYQINENDVGTEIGQDCNGDCFGTAFIDDCDVCSGGETGHPVNDDQDCAGVCDGTSIIDECGVCTDNFNTIENTQLGINNFGCGCFVQGPQTHYLDEDGDGMGVNDMNNPDSTAEYCTVISQQGRIIYELAPDNYVLNADDLDPVCPLGTQYDCGGNCILEGQNAGMICPGTLTDFEMATCSEFLVDAYVFDCNGVCNGDSVFDECGVCGGDNSTCADCEGTPNGPAVIDECGDCTGGNTGNSYNYNMDCSGTCNGNHEILTYYYDGDGDGIGCSDDGFQWTGCSNNVPPNYVLGSDDGLEEGDLCECNGQFDECGVCEGGNTLDENGLVTGPDADCAGVCFGEAVIDDCGVCNGTNDCYGCTYPDADNFDGLVEDGWIDDGSCEYIELIKDIYESPAIYIQGDRSLQYISFFLPDFVDEYIQNKGVKSSKHLVCAGTKGEDEEADEFCNRPEAYEGESCGFNVAYTCLEISTNIIPGLPCDFIGCNADCTSDNYFEGSGLPDCDALEAFSQQNGGGFFEGYCSYGGVCEKYEIHRIMMNSFYPSNPDDSDGVQSDSNLYSSGDELKVITYNEDESKFEQKIIFDPSGAGWVDENNLFFKVGVGYYLKTENSGWFKLTPTREIFDWEENEEV